MPSKSGGMFCLGIEGLFGVAAVGTHHMQCLKVKTFLCSNYVAKYATTINHLVKTTISIIFIIFIIFMLSIHHTIST